MSTLNGEYREFHLGNGLLVSLNTIPTNTIASRLSVNHGTVHELKGEEGFSHLLEHILFKDGTHKHFVEESEAIRNSLGKFEPATGLDRTSFPAGIIPSNLELMLEYLSGIVFTPRFDKGIFLAEKAAVIRDIADERSKPYYKDEKEFNRALYGAHPYNQDVFGKATVIRSAKIDDLRDFYSRGFHAGNAHLILAGPLPENVESLIGKYFDNIPGGEPNKFEFPPLNPLQKNVVLERMAKDLLDIEEREESSAFLNLGLVVPPYNSEHSDAMAMIGQLLISYTECRLFRKLRGQDGNIYDINGGYRGTYNKGIIEIFGKVKALNVSQVVDSIFSEFQRLRQEEVPESELRMITDYLDYNIKAELETSQGHVKAIGRKVATGLTPNMWLDKMRGVTPEQIKQAAMLYLPESRENGRYVLLIRNPLLEQ
ncbi:insulinase family protein [Candidatus Woesearchaeota archaeon]|nr:insulinase family protein [Candidatus Woesearchaeota archaeon]